MKKICINITLFNKYLRLISLVVLLLYGLNYDVKAQSSCPNADFETATLSNWTCYTGEVKDSSDLNVIYMTATGEVWGRHTIFTGTGKDPNTDFNVSFVAPGGQFSCRLGNDDDGAEAERMTYTINVTSSNTLFIYKYAVVLENPSHDIWKQPRFLVELKDDLGNLLSGDSACTYYSVFAADTIPGFQSNGNIKYKDWTTVGVDLTPYIGQNVTISFTTADCTEGAHFGYAYIDAYCSELQINVIYCPGADSITLTAPEGFSYLWAPGGDTTQSVTIPSSDSLVAYTCTLTSATGCQVVLSTNLMPTVLNAGFTYNSSTCTSMSFTDTSYISDGIITNWLWNFDDPGSGVNNTSVLKNPTHNFTSDGTFDVRLIITTDDGCTDTITVPVNVSSVKPIADFSANNVCLNDTVFFNDLSTVSSGTITGWAWNFGDGGASASQDPFRLYSNANTYNVRLIVTASSGCKDTVYKDITVYPIPDPNIGDSIYICMGNDTVLTANGGPAYQWNTTETTSSITVSPVATATYSVTVTDANSCSETDDIVVYVGTSLNVSAGTDDTVCSGFSSVLTATGAGGSGTYIWNTLQTSSSITVTPVSDATYTVTGTNTDGCSGTDEVIVFVNTLTDADAGIDTSICSGSDAILTASGGNTYLWNTTETTQSITVTPNISATYTVTCTDINSCSDTDEVVVNVVSVPTASINTGQDTVTVCDGNSVTLKAGGGTTYIWNTTETTDSIIVSPAATATYTVTAVNSICTDTAEIIVEVVPLPVVSFSADDTSGCVPLSVNFTDNTSSAIQDWLWDFGDGTTSAEQNPLHTYTADGTYDVTLTVTDDNGCSGLFTYQNMITAYPQPEAGFSMYPDPGSIDNPVISFTNISLCADSCSWLWRFGDLYSSDLQNPTHTYSSSGTYTVWLITENEYGCIDSIYHELVINDNNAIYIPSAFTPNNDGKNDVFIPVGLNISDFEMYIYDRWGEKIFHTNDLGKPWTGKVKNSNKIATEGVYAYVILIKDNKGTQYKYFGHVTVLR